MRIQSQLVLSIAVSFLVSAMIVCVALFILRGIKIELERSRVYDEAFVKANALNVLLAELKENANPSDLPQILNVHASIGDLLNKMSSGDAIEESLIRQIQRSHEKLGFLLAQFPASGTRGHQALNKERKAIFDSQLWMKVRHISDEIFRLRGMSQSRIVSAQAYAGITVFFLLVTLVLSNTLISVLSGRNILQSGESLRESEAGYRSLFETANVAKSMTLPSGEINVNRAFCELLGYGPEEVRNKTWQELTPAEEIGPISDILAPLLRGEKYTARFEKRYIHKNGSHVWTDVSTAIDRNSEGQPTHFITTIVDITDRKRAEAARLQSEKQFRRIVESSPAAIYFYRLDSEDRLIFIGANPSFDRILGVSHKDFLGKTIDEVFPSLATTEIPEMYRNVALGRIGPQVFESAYQDERVNSYYAVTVFKTAHRTIAVNFTDIAERKQAEEEIRKLNVELEQRVADRTRELKDSQLALLNVVDDLSQKTEELATANEKLQELDRLKSMFIASMSHELRTPLNSIIGFTGIILMGMSGEISSVQKKQLTMVKNSANHLLDLINDVIDISKIEAGKTDLSIEAFDLSGLVLEVKDAFSVAAVEKEFKLEWGMGGVLEVTSDRRRVRQILVNLIGNAVKFTETGMVEISVSKTKKGVDIKVCDTGIGIQREDMERLFQAFSRIHIQGRPVVEGTGLGLYLSRRLAALLGGDITAESEPGRGSKFSLFLPWKYPEEKNEKNIGSRGQRTKPLSHAVHAGPKRFRGHPGE